MSTLVYTTHVQVLNARKQSDQAHKRKHAEKRSQRTRSRALTAAPDCSRCSTTAKWPLCAARIMGVSCICRIETHNTVLVEMVLLVLIRRCALIRNLNHDLLFPLLGQLWRFPPACCQYNCHRHCSDCTHTGAPAWQRPQLGKRLPRWHYSLLPKAAASKYCSGTEQHAPRCAAQCRPLHPAAA